MSITVLPGIPGFKYGCDPELFVKKDGIYIPADMIPGTKENPHVVPKGAVQRDGMAAEFNIDPVTSFEEWDDSITTVIAEMAKFLPDGASFEAVSSVTFDETVFAQASDTAKALGCSPDHNAWTGEVNPPPNDPENPLTRCAGGHIHFGWREGAEADDVQHILNCRDLVKQLDWYLGAWSIRHDPDATRRRLYGKAGACRYKPYGVEYRVLSNFWVLDQNKRLAVWNRMQEAIKAMKSGFLPDIAGKAYNDLVIQQIDTSERIDVLEGRWKTPLMHVPSEITDQPRYDPFNSRRAMKSKTLPLSSDPFQPLNF